VRHTFIALALLTGLAAPATAQFSISIGLPHVSIGVNLPFFPQLVLVPGYPVYYAPDLDSNYFFYDGLYLVYQDDNWYSSDWYNGPWGVVDPSDVPLFVLRVPVRYYRSPPSYFRGWASSAPPRWGDHWGPAWQQRRPGWDRWNRAGHRRRRRCRPTSGASRRAATRSLINSAICANRTRGRVRAARSQWRCRRRPRPRWCVRQQTAA
jgi:hypothetical protein